MPGHSALGTSMTKLFWSSSTRVYDYQKSLSDISGWDICAHKGDHLEAVRCVRDWLVAVAGTDHLGPSHILGEYTAFQEWYWERSTATGASETDIMRYPTVEIVAAMHEWTAAGKPRTI